MHYEESKIQAEICRKLSRRGIYFFAIQNEGKRSMKQAQIAKAMGLRSGVSDMVIVLHGRVIFLEIKKSGGYQTQNQKDFEEKVSSLEHIYRVARSWEDVVLILEENGVIL